jgi:arginase
MIVHDRRFPVVLGGDCPVMLGALSVLQDEQDRPGLLFVDGHEDAWPPLASPTGEAADCELGLALGLFDAVLDRRLRGVLPRIRGADVIAIGPRSTRGLPGRPISPRRISMRRSGPAPPSSGPVTASPS